MKHGLGDAWVAVQTVRASCAVPRFRSTGTTTVGRWDGSLLCE